jgi:hypothetical protein
LKKSLLIIPLLLLVSGLALTACGGGGSSSSGSGEEGAIEEAIETSATTTDPSKCTELQTQKFNEQDTGTSGEEAIEKCEEEAEEQEDSAESVEVSNVSVEGESATAEAAITGSALNGQTVELELVEEEGAWKLNQFLGFSEFDGTALSEALQKEFESAKPGETETAECVGEAFNEVSQEEAEEVDFEHNVELLGEILQKCK